MIDPQAVPLSLYIHLPWCTRKCPYCDFNSHEGFTESLQQPYIDALLADLDSQQAWWRDRPIESIFIGGGTPSLFEGRWLGTLLEGYQTGQRYPAMSRSRWKVTPVAPRAVASPSTGRLA